MCVHHVMSCCPQTLSDPGKRALYDALAGFGQGVNPFRDTAFPADQVSTTTASAGNTCLELVDFYLNPVLWTVME